MELEQTLAQRMISERINSKKYETFIRKCNQTYEAYEDHVDSFVLKSTQNLVLKSEQHLIKPLIKERQKTYAQKTILRRISKVQKNVLMSAYGESLYGDHVDSPAYEDYLESNCGDQE